MEACESCEKTRDKEGEEEIEINPNGESDQCAADGDSFGALRNAEIDGLVSDKSATTGSAMVSEEIEELLDTNSASDSTEFEFDISGLNARQALTEMDSIGSPADELFYKGRLLPLDVPLRIQMMENLICSETRQSQQNVLNPYAVTQTEIESSNCFGIEIESEELGFHTHCESSVATPSFSSDFSNNNRDCEELGFHAPCKTSDVCPHKVHNEFNETYRNGSPPASGRRQSQKLPDSTHSKHRTLLHKLKASKAFVSSLFSKASKASNTRSRACDHHSDRINTQKESYEYEDAAAFDRSIPREKSHATHRKCFSGSFSFIKESLLIPKPNSKSLNSPRRECPSHSGALLKRSRGTASNLDVENGIQGVIADCNQYSSANPISRRI